MHSIILTIHNGARRMADGEILLERVLDGLINNSVGDYELLCMLDGCTDGSELIVEKYIDSSKHLDIRAIITPDIYELRTNNVGFKASKGEYVIVVQDDQIVTEPGWNRRMQEPFDVFDDVFAVTARTAHNWILNPNSKHFGTDTILDNCWCDIFLATDHAYGYPIQMTNYKRDEFAVRGTVNRGPLMINHKDLRSMNYLDDEFAPCDMDDHDLMFRAYKQLGKICGGYRIGVESKPAWSGSTVSGSVPPWALRSHHKNCRIFYSRNKDVLTERRIVENRRITH